MKKRNYKRIFRPGTLFRVAGSNAVFMSLGLNQKDNRQISSFNGMDIVRRCAVKWADGRAVPATRREQQAYWAVMREVIARREEAPKFSPGDWITDIRTGRYDLVESYRNGYYRCENSGFPKHHQVGYRRWNINDARPGDILFYHPEKMVFIFKGIEGDDRKLKLFCSCDTETPELPGAFQLYSAAEYFGRADDRGITPANNKQRRMMFAKMQSEGYDLYRGMDGQLKLAKIRNNDKED